MRKYVEESMRRQFQFCSSFGNLSKILDILLFKLLFKLLLKYSKLIQLFKHYLILDLLLSLRLEGEEALNYRCVCGPTCGKV